MNPELSDKARAELAFWNGRLQQEGILTNDHYEYFYTSHFGLNREFYQGRSILDIGCGPRGSLEWAAMARTCIGLDPLAGVYGPLGINRHAMQYVAGTGEQMPFLDARFDAISSFNSLDHVDNLESVIDEIIRVLAPAGLFLLLTDIHRLPTTLEPAAFSWDIVTKFQPALELVEEHHFEYSAKSPDGFGDIYGSLRSAIPYDHVDQSERYGILSAIFHKPVGSGLEDKSP